MDAGSISCAASSSEAAHWLSEGGEVREEGRNYFTNTLQPHCMSCVQVFGDNK